MAWECSQPHDMWFLGFGFAFFSNKIETQNMLSEAWHWGINLQRFQKSAMQSLFETQKLTLQPVPISIVRFPTLFRAQASHGVSPRIILSTGQICHVKGQFSSNGAGLMKNERQKKTRMLPQKVL